MVMTMRRNETRVISLVIAETILAAGLGFAQSSENDGLHFEVASVKKVGADAARKSSTRPSASRPNPAVVRYSHTTLKSLLQDAYGVPQDRISGPSWLDSELFAITAKAPPGTTKEQSNVMLQNLLTERFKLLLHRESKELPVYALLVEKNGPKTKHSLDDGIDSSSRPGSIGKDGFPEVPHGYAGINIFIAPGRARISCMRQPLSEFAKFLGLQLARPVVDQTGLSGNYDINLDFTPGEGQSPKGPMGEDLPFRLSPSGQDGPDLFAAPREQLGLRLQATKSPVERLVVDRAEKVPVEN
jgi:uncharacterized protein (TIGR03435 family)